MSQLKVNSIVPVGGLPSGSNGGIIQVKQTIKKDVFTTSQYVGSGYTDLTGLSVAITPSSNSNKILVVTQIYNGAANNAVNFLERRFGGVKFVLKIRMKKVSKNKIKNSSSIFACIFQKSFSLLQVNNSFL